VRRVAGWLGIVALAACAHYYDNPTLRAALMPAIVLVLAFNAPATMRLPLVALALLGAVPIALGFGERVLDLTPALIAWLVGWMFARTLIGGRRPLIARAVLAMDGPALLDDPAVVRYARRLTRLWALYQGVLGLIALALALRVWCCPQCLPDLPGPRLFGAVGLPLAVAGLLLVEFALRPRLLPQAPPRSLYAFVLALVSSWPALVQE